MSMRIERNATHGRVSALALRIGGLTIVYFFDTAVTVRELRICR